MQREVKAWGVRLNGRPLGMKSQLELTAEVHKPSKPTGSIRLKYSLSQAQDNLTTSDCIMLAESLRGFVSLANAERDKMKKQLEKARIA